MDWADRCERAGRERRETVERERDCRERERERERTVEKERKMRRRV
jgi:hypothetical protein